MTPAFRCTLLVALVVLPLLSTGCGSGADTTGPPEGWRAEETRWWRPDVDTARAFADRGGFRDMGLDYEEAIFAAGAPVERQPDRMRQRLVNDVRRKLLPLYRHRPQIVDSLFAADVEPRIMAGEAPTREELPERVVVESREARRRLRERFRAPRLESRLGEDVPLVVPDSLREPGLEGRVHVQVYLDEEGRAAAVRIREGLHPVLDRKTLAAAARMQWHAARLEGAPIPSWTELTVRFDTDSPASR